MRDGVIRSAAATTAAILTAIAWAGGACAPDAGACDEANGTPGCEDTTCCGLICIQDPFCCDVAWDEQCADHAVADCTGDVCGPGAGGCCEPNGTPGCDQLECCEVICASDAFCCDVEWDAICADAVTDVCSLGCLTDNCGAGAGPCDQPNGTPGCDDDLCCQQVCFIDAFCCNVEWDVLCVEAAAVCDCACAWDLDGDCVVTPADLAALLSAWGQPYGASDLASLLAEWGCHD